MRTRLALALAISTIGLVLGTASPAAAAQTFIPHYNAEGDYVGCTAVETGQFYYPNQITELGCHTEPEAPQ